MKRTCLIAIVFIPVLLFPKSGLWFSFKTGFPIAGSSVGIKLGPLAPYGGLDIVYIGASMDYNSTSWERDYDYDWQTGTYIYGDWYKSSERSNTFEGHATLYMPHGGLRFYLAQQTLKLYLKGDLTLVFPSVDGTGNYESIYYDQDGNIEDIYRDENKLTDKEKKDINDALNYFIISPGIGLEYPFSEHFSIGGEFGFRLLHNTMDTSDKSEDDYWKDSWQTKMSTTLGVSYTLITLNYIL
ncbi:MAG: hypothetical protein GXO90_02865 [FCB group bacterium]|nr:hypothetical protein [FCB group bacterium]